MQDRDMLHAPIGYYRRPNREPAGVPRPPLSRRAHYAMRAIGGVCVFALVALFAFAGLPVIADKNAFALPVEHGLPYQFHHGGYPYE